MAVLKAWVLVTDYQGCIMQLRDVCDAEGRPLLVMDRAEVIAERLAALGGR